MDLLHSPETKARESRLRKVLTELSIPQAHLNAVQLYGQHQPYHNWGHCAIVALNCYAGGLAENVAPAALRTLVLAGLYHDYDHTGSTHVADILNICRAISGSAFWLSVEEPAMARSEKNRVATLIAATEASHAHIVQDRLEGIIMDADLLATHVPDREAWWAALSAEIGVPVTLASTQAFLRGREFHTRWGMSGMREVLAMAQASDSSGKPHATAKD